jgi:hypothetical protein
MKLREANVNGLLFTIEEIKLIGGWNNGLEAQSNQHGHVALISPKSHHAKKQGSNLNLSTAMKNVDSVNKAPFSIKGNVQIHNSKLSYVEALDIRSLNHFRICEVVHSTDTCVSVDSVKIIGSGIIMVGNRCTHTKLQLDASISGPLIKLNSNCVCRILTLILSCFGFESAELSFNENSDSATQDLIAETLEAKSNSAIIDVLDVSFSFALLNGLCLLHSKSILQPSSDKLSENFALPSIFSKGKLSFVNDLDLPQDVLETMSISSAHLSKKREPLPSYIYVEINIPPINFSPSICLIARVMVEDIAAMSRILDEKKVIGLIYIC